MYLSKLEVIGFKSFAQKVNLVFDSGISAIVGPNGCGKTNIVDAIRWVLGEQRYSALRSDKMEDVIFNGTKTRKALGMAEASLVIENTKGILPSEYTQVTIGRRVYRSGESEYLLNKVPCRLKDILDLFMDTGMGSDAYSVIELKMIETILSDKADERRRLFEEAAGVTKYKHRRKAAYRKLEDVQADLTRLNDIVVEVQKSVNSLERQARKAEQFNELKSKLRVLEVDLMEREYAHLEGRIAPLHQTVAGLQTHRTSLNLGLSEGESRIEELRSTLLEVEKRLAEAQRDVSLHREKTHQIEQKTLVAAERVSALRATVERVEHEEEELIREIDGLLEAETMLIGRIAGSQVQEEKTFAEQRDKQEELRLLGEVLDERKRELQALNDRIFASVKEIAGQEAAQERRRERVDNLAGRKTRATDDIKKYDVEIARLETVIADLTAEDRRLRRLFTESEMNFYNAEKRRKEIAGRLDDLQRLVLETRSEIDRRSEKIGFLRGLIESREGLPEGARFLAGSEQWKPVKFLTVADAVHAEERLRPAMEAALADVASCIIVESVSDVTSAIELLRSEDRGKAEFICLDRLPALTSTLPDPAGAGILGWASALAEYEKDYAPLFHLLLDRVLVVDSRETAVRVAPLFPGTRCVTIDGEIESGTGFTRGGSRRQSEGGMIGKHQQIEALLAESEQLNAKIKALEAERETAQKDAEGIDLKALGDEVKGVEKEMNAVEMKIAQIQFEKKRALDIVEKSREDIGLLDVEVGELRAEIDAETPLLNSYKEGRSEVERGHAEASAAIAIQEQEWNERSEAVRDLGIAVVHARNELGNARNELERTRRRIEEIRGAISKHRADAVSAAQSISETEELMGFQETALEQLRKEMEGLQARRVATESEAAGVRDTIHAIELSIRDQRRTHDDSVRELHEHELQLQDLRAKVEHLLLRAREEFELVLELKSYPDEEFVDFAKLRDEIPQLREKIKSLGNINFAAFEEYTAEKQRYENLNTQRQDLVEAEKNLLATIEEINATAQRQFLETFFKIRANFIDTFKGLFDPGDECDLKLEENVDPLEAKIEIVAKPRGKRPTSIDLLSGGEKTLTAIALLFAIYLVKPSPFCILDEVDAPLDDANVDRFTRIIRKFSDNTQFIVVTHNKRSMEAANALYGVTMEEEGVSKIVTVRFNQGGTVESAALAAG
jgi:chromosome segregation protein